MLSFKSIIVSQPYFPCVSHEREKTNNTFSRVYDGPRITIFPQNMTIHVHLLTYVTALYTFILKHFFIKFQVNVSIQNSESEMIYKDIKHLYH